MKFVLAEICLQYRFNSGNVRAIWCEDGYLIVYDSSAGIQ